MSTKQVAAHIPEEDYYKIVEEFQANGCKSINDYLKQIIDARNEKTISLNSGDAERMKAMYEGKIEVLNEQLALARTELTAHLEKGGLAGTDAKEQNVQAIVNKALKEEREKRKQEDMEKSNIDLTTKVAELTEKNTKLEATVQSDARMAKVAEVGMAALEGFSRINPQAAQRITNGLAGFFPGGGEIGAIGEGGLSPDQENAYKAGLALLNEFPEEQQKMAVIALVEYFAANLPALSKFVANNAHFKNWYQQQQPQPPAP